MAGKVLTKKQEITSEQHLRKFASALEKQIAKYKVARNEESFFNHQKDNLEKLVELENEFKSKLLSYEWGDKVYKSFVKYITKERKNILIARPYFRERQTIFTAEISKALKAKDHKALTKFNINWHFIKFVVQNSLCKNKRELNKIVKEIARIRKELVEVNLPLAVSRAKLFYSKTPKSQLSYMDLIQIAAEGLLAAVDKYVLPYSTNFRAVIIGRISGNFIEEYSEPVLHLYPGDRRRLYRLNKLMSKTDQSNIDYEALAKGVNEGMEGTQKATASELAELINATTSVMSSDLDISESSHPAIQHAAPLDHQPDVRIEENDLHYKLKKAISELSVFERKFLKLKGIGNGI